MPDLDARALDALLERLEPTLDCNCGDAPLHTRSQEGCRDIGCSAARLSAYRALRLAAKDAAAALRQLRAERDEARKMKAFYEHERNMWMRATQNMEEKMKAAREPAEGA